MREKTGPEILNSLADELLLSFLGCKKRNLRQVAIEEISLN